MGFIDTVRGHVAAESGFIQRVRTDLLVKVGPGGWSHGWHREGVPDVHHQPSLFDDLEHDTPHVPQAAPKPALPKPAAVEKPATMRYHARGTTDEVTQCEVCGKPELKGTVLLGITDEHGDSHGEVYAGASCAARLAGRPVKDIKTEAARGDQETSDRVRAAHREWSNALGAWQAGNPDAGAHAAWLASHPEPSDPTGRLTPQRLAAEAQQRARRAQAAVEREAARRARQGG